VTATSSPATRPAESSVALPRLRRYRVQVFASTWASYAGFYFCRKAFFIVKGDLTTELGFDAATLGQIGFVYLLAYAIGEFNAAFWGSRLGARRLLLTGMAVSVGANVVFGFANNTWTFMAFMALNGLAQATGWSGNVGTMAHWFRRRERGRVMGVWATCYQVGGALANGCASFLLGWLGWRWSFFGASLVLGGIWFLFYFLQKNRPEDVGLPALADDDPAPPTATGAPQAHVTTGFDRQLVTTILMMGAFYFFIKFIRYALWSWAPYFLKLNLGLASDAAGYFSTLFDIFGFFGVLVAGFVSDRVGAGRRLGVTMWMVLGLVLSTALLWSVGVHAVWGFGVAISLIGFTLYGPDSLMSGAGAIDVGSRRYALVAAGVINGMGSCGSVVQDLLIGNLYKDNPKDLTPILMLLLGSACVAAVMLLLLARRNRAGKCNL
jgi:sugar phosphate permease